MPALDGYWNRDTAVVMNPISLTRCAMLPTGVMAFFSGFISVGWVAINPSLICRERSDCIRLAQQGATQPLRLLKSSRRALRMRCPWLRNTACSTRLLLCPELRQVWSLRPTQGPPAFRVWYSHHAYKALDLHSGDCAGLFLALMVTRCRRAVPSSIGSGNSNSDAVPDASSRRSALSSLSPRPSFELCSTFRE